MKKRKKNTAIGKLVLAVLLFIIMLGLLVGKIYVQKHPKEEPTTEPLVEDTTIAEETEPETMEETTEAPTETTTEAVTAPVSLPAATIEKPIIVDPNAEKWELTLVNLQYRLPDKYKPSLQKVIDGSAVQLDTRIAGAYAEMYEAAKADGCLLTPYAGYTSFARQEENYSRKVNFFMGRGMTEEEAKAKANQFILPAGCSEHNLGLAIDIVSASADFSATKEFSWLLEHAQDYGFILRYPEDKSEITGVGYQPWHWRYVGADAAKAMKTNNQCLEEYLGVA